MRSTSTAAASTRSATRSSSSRYYNEEEGLRIYAQALTTNFVSEFTFEDYNLLDTMAPWKEALLGTIEEKQARLADPERRVALKAIDDARGGLFGAGYVTREIKVNWISSDAPNAQEIKERYEGFTLGEIADREGKHPIDAMLDIAVMGDLKVGLRDEAPRDAARGDEGDRRLAGRAARRERRRRPHQVRHDGPLPHRAAQPVGPRARDHVARGGPLAAVGLPGPGRRPEGPRRPARGRAGRRDRLRLRALDSGPQERLWDYPAGEMRLVQKAVGYEHTIVNGVETFVEGECTDATPGKLLRHGTD